MGNIRAADKEAEIAKPTRTRTLEALQNSYGNSTLLPRRENFWGIALVISQGEDQVNSQIFTEVPKYTLLQSYYLYY